MGCTLCPVHLCPHWARERNAWCPQETANGNFYFPNISFLLKGIPLVCNKARVAEISTAHHRSREWSNSSDERVVRGSRRVFFRVGGGFIFTFHLFFLLLGKQFSTFRQICLKIFPQYFYFFLCYCLPLPSLRIQTLPQRINNCWEIAMLFFCKVHFLGQLEAPCVF